MFLVIELYPVSSGGCREGRWGRNECEMRGDDADGCYVPLPNLVMLGEARRMRSVSITL